MKFGFGVNAFFKKVPAEFWAIFWGVVVGLSMMRIPSAVFFTPIYVLATLSLVMQETRAALFGFLNQIRLVVVYFAFSVLSLVWAAQPVVSLHELRGDLLIPCLAFIASFGMARQIYRDRGLTAVFLLSVWCVFLVGSLVAWLLFKEAWINSLFDSVGYYSTYLFLLSGLSLPFLSARWRLLFYPVLSILLFLTAQRVAWVLFPVIGCADLFFCQGSGRKRWRMMPLLLVLLGFSYFMMKGIVESKPADAYRPEIQAHGVAARLAHNERLVAWQQWFARGEERPLLGHGFGRQNVLEHFSGKESWPEKNLYHAHNVVLNHFLQLGAIGVLLYFAAQIQLLRYLVTRHQRLATAAALMIAFFFLRNLFDDFSIKRLLIVYALMIGWCIGQLFAADERASEQKGAS